MIPFRNIARALALALVVSLFWALGIVRAASGPGKTSRAAKKAQAGKSGRSVSANKGVKKTAGKKRRSRRRSTYSRLANFKMQPERAVVIQQALIDRGYLHQEPSGVWDDSTKAAMKRFQVDFQFPATGMPEAKSLMKLGLGPHPLPPELDPELQTRAQAEIPAAPERAASALPGGSQ